MCGCLSPPAEEKHDWKVEDLLELLQSTIQDLSDSQNTVDGALREIACSTLTCSSEQAGKFAAMSGCGLVRLQPISQVLLRYNAMLTGTSSAMMTTVVCSAV